MALKMLYIDPVRLPTEKAHGIQIMEMCAAFIQHGVDVELVVSDRRTQICEDPFEYYDVHEQFPISRISAPDLVAFGPVGFQLFLLVFCFRALRYVRRMQPDRIYTRSAFLARILSYAFPHKVIWEVHGRYRISTRALRSLALIVPITEALREWYEEIGAPANKLLVAPDGVNLAPFGCVTPSVREVWRAELRARLDLPAATPVALYFGSFGVYDWKGVDIAKEAAMHAKDVTWLFVGGSDEECRALIKNTSSNVRTLPRVKRSDIARLLCAVDVLLLPNKKGDIHSAYDTSPLKLFEYMASAVPIVASGLPSIREVLDDRSAILVKPNDPVALAGAVENALHDRSKAADLSRTARERVARYTWAKRAEVILRRLQDGDQPQPSL